MILVQTWLTRRVRIAIMCTLITLFFIISPLVILYTAGYRYDATNGRILQTGVISIDVLPKEANTILNTVAIDKRQPVRLTNRAPGSYQVELSAEGYHDWQKIITVGSKQTTYISDVVLLKESNPVYVPSLALSASGTSYAAHSKPYILRHAADSSLHELSLVLADNAAETPIVRMQAEKLERILWSLDESAVAVVFDIEDSYETVYIQLGSSVQTAQLTSTEVPQLYFRGDTLLVQADKSWTEIRTNGSSKVFTFASSTPIMPMAKIGDWYYMGETTKELTEGSGELLVRFDTDISDILMISDRSIVATEDDNILVFDRSGTNATLRERINNPNVFATDNGLVLSTASSIYTVDASASVNLLYRTSDSLKSVTHIDRDKGEYILTTPEQLLHYDPAFNIITPLLDIDAASTVAAANGATVYFESTIGEQTGMFALEI